ncbi:hypothetical protein [Actinoplanes missouriensis]|uniref:hypothetical protein n=1 Tax=Actinoplanes missouriensis TaxID=1866 RepID=UPI0002EBCCCD|nr:hypothetical protein [Actinoplanes missouriensis]
MIEKVRDAHRPRAGRRLLRFLAHLAVLALAATLHLPVTSAVPAPPTPLADFAVTAFPALKAGEVPQATGPRAPPAA